MAKRCIKSNSHGVSKITPKKLSPFLKLRSLLEGIGKFLRNSVKEKLCKPGNTQNSFYMLRRNLKDLDLFELFGKVFGITSISK